MYFARRFDLLISRFVTDVQMADDEADARILQCIAVDVNLIHIFFFGDCIVLARSTFILGLGNSLGRWCNSKLSIIHLSFRFDYYYFVCVIFHNNSEQIRFGAVFLCDACARVSVSAVA